MSIHVKYVILINLLNIIIFVLAENPSSEMPKPASISALLIAFILVSKSGYAKTFITITVIYLGFNCKQDSVEGCWK